MTRTPSFELARLLRFELARLLRSDCCDPRGAATASWLLRHPEGPLYVPYPPGTLASAARRATNNR
jgi:hypothetical protein